MPPNQSSGTALNGIVVNPDGQSVYAVDVVTPGTIYQYDILAGGVLAPKMQATVSASGASGGIAVSPDGESVYAAANGSAPNTGSVLQYSVGAGGSLVPKSPSSAPTGGNTTNLAVNPDGKSVYAANTSNHNIAQFDVNGDGTLAAKSTPTVATGQAPWKFAISRDGTSVYVTGYGANQAVDDGSVSQFSVGGDGGLSPKSPAAVSTGPNPRGAVVSTDGGHLYVVNQSNAPNPSEAGVFQYDVGAGGTLAPRSPSLVAVGAQPDGIAISPIRTPPGGGAGGGMVQRTRITSGPSGVTGSAPRFTFESGDPGAKFECRFDDEPFRPCKSPLTRYGLAFGPHTFYVRSLAPDDLGDSRSFTLAIVTEDKSCTVDAATDTVPGDDYCILYGDCPARSECRLRYLQIDTTDPKRMGFGLVDLDVCLRNGKLGNPRYCDVQDRADGHVGSNWCYFPTAGLSTVQTVCPNSRTFTDQSFEYEIPVPRYAAVCRLVQQQRGGVGQATCIVRLEVRPADLLGPRGGAGGMFGLFASGPGRLTVAPKPSGTARATAASKRRPFRTIRRTVKGEGWITLEPKLSRKAAATLRRKRKLRLPLKITFVPQEGTRIVRNARVTLRTFPCRLQSPTRSKDGKLRPPRRTCN